MQNLKNIDDYICLIQNDFTEEEIVQKVDELLMNKEITYKEGVEQSISFIYKGLDFDSWFIKGEGDDELYPPEACFYIG